MSALTFESMLKIRTSAPLQIDGDQFGAGVSEAKNRPEFRPQLCVFHNE